MSAPRRGGGSTAKAFLAQVDAALQSSSRIVPTIRGVDCSRLWIQGVVVETAADGQQCVVDDGTGVVRIELKVFLKNSPPGVDARPQPGDYVMAIGPLQRAEPNARALLAHQMMKLDAKMQREATWFLEVVEYWTSVVSTA